MVRRDLEEEITQQLSKDLAEDIDRSILWGWLMETGWKKISLLRFKNNKHAVDIKIWIDENCKHKVLYHGVDFLFENEKDAILFVLTWYE